MIFFVVLVDQASKLAALRILFPGETVPVIQGLFHFTLIQNTGIAFGFFREHQGLLLILISVSLIFLWIWALRMEGGLGSRYAFALILGGAAGNWIDRMRFGAVIDFLDFRVWPVFNIADSAITLGVAIYFLLLLKKKKT